MPTPYAIYCIIISVFTFQISAAPRALKEGQLPDDIRLLPLKDLNGYFPFDPPSSKKDWEKKSSKIRHFACLQGHLLHWLCLGIDQTIF